MAEKTPQHEDNDLLWWVGGALGAAAVGIGTAYVLTRRTASSTSTPASSAVTTRYLNISGGQSSAPGPSGATIPVTTTTTTTAPQLVVVGIHVS